MNAMEVMAELEALGTDRQKKNYLGRGAHEPLFGVPTGKMKPILKRTKLNQELAEQLYATGNYDAMYFAGVIAEPARMSEADFERWIGQAPGYMIAEFAVSVTLAEAPIGQAVAEKWIYSEEEIRQTAGWNCYCWMLGNLPDEVFNLERIRQLLEKAHQEIHGASERTKVAMNNFLYTVGISYKPLSEEATAIAKEVGPLEIQKPKKKPTILHAWENIQKDLEKGRLGFKRKHVRC
ncbi:MAG: DNA alkylation repair protein [Turicibacter sp.]|nr:DNA alkylation repair protein [Turicibacter sp.]